MWSEDAVSVDLAAPSPAVGRVLWRPASLPPPHPLNASQLICHLCHDFYPLLEVNHAWKGSQDHPLTFRNQSQLA